jgi:hypothetical protein
MHLMYIDRDGRSQVPAVVQPAKLQWVKVPFVPFENGLCWSEVRDNPRMLYIRLSISGRRALHVSRALSASLR